MNKELAHIIVYVVFGLACFLAVVIGRRVKK